MNAKSLLNWGILDWIKDFFLGILDNIPRLVYFFFAAFASGVDALQNLLRKLAGLDVYYMKGVIDNSTSQDVIDGTVSIVVKKDFAAQWGKDPLTEFIYGTLGIGDYASAYRSLTTVFWSLSIFAIIILVLSTMVAMIKSHYSEDYQNTNPWKYIYTAIKAVLTYAVMPIVVVLGMQISHFILQTLDNITAGTDASKVEAMFGRTVARTNFKRSTYAEGYAQAKETYTHYDFFGAGGPTTTTTFGGMLFTAAAYSANRARTQNITIAQLEGTKVFANSSCPAYSNLSSTNDKRNYAADQIDFAFANNIRWADGTNNTTDHRKNIGDLEKWFPDVRYGSGTDFLGSSKTKMDGFSKYNIQAVWMFYDLWQFQFIVAFGGGVTAVGILLSVILGMMSRLIKGAALFLIYPPLIALAPLDNFKAFKSWGTQFMQQVLMAYGAVIGMNILMLVLPLVQNISWYGPDMGIIDAIVNMIILIVGILMTKDFIAIVSGFIGGADANAIGQGLKTEVGGAVKKGVGAVKFAGGAVKTGIAGVRLAGGVVKGGIKAVANVAKRKGNVDALNAKEGLEEKAKAGRAKVSVLDAEIGKMSGFANKAEIDKSDLTDSEKKTAEAALKARNKVRNAGGSVEEQEAAAKAVVEKKLKSTFDGSKDGVQISKFARLKEQQEENLKNLEKEEKESGNTAGLSKKETEQLKRARDVQAKIESGELHYDQKAVKDKNGNIVKNADGSNKMQYRFGKNMPTKEDIGEGFVKGIKGIGKGLSKAFDAKEAGKEMGDAFLKSMNEMGQMFGLDKIVGGLKDVLGPAFTKKGGVFEHKAAEGDALHRETAATAKAHNEQQIRAQEKTNQLLAQLIQSNHDIKKASDATNLAISRLKMPNNNTNNGNGKK